MLAAYLFLLTSNIAFIAYRLITIVRFDYISFFRKFPRIPWFSQWNRVTRERRQLAELISCMRQLLYLRDLPIHLHSKLQKCIPVTRIIRTPLTRLIHDWYANPAEAIATFRSTLQHDQADGFCDTLRAMAEVGEEPFYEHLQSRMEDLKLLLHQRQEAQKETRSYVFFGLAGIPLIHSFQLFLYPWLAQSSSVFQTIH